MLVTGIDLEFNASKNIAQTVRSYSTRSYHDTTPHTETELSHPHPDIAREAFTLETKQPVVLADLAWCLINLAPVRTADWAFRLVL